MSHEYRSAAKYHFLEEQGDAIVRAAAYHYKDHSLSMIWFSSREHIAIRESISTPFPRTPNASLGALDRLPLELLVDVFLHLDIYSLFKFRQINLRSRQVIDSLQEYWALTAHGLNPLCALLRTRLATFVSLSDFYHLLCTKNCAFCGEFGGFVFLPTWSRCCSECVREAPETRMETLASLRKRFRLTQALVSKLRFFKSLPGTYTMDESTYKSRFIIAPLHQVILISKKQPQAGEQPPTRGPICKYNYMASCALPYYERRSGKFEDGISCDGCQLAIEKYFWDEAWAWKARDKVYTQGDFLEHFKWCKQAQLLWESSEQGTIASVGRPRERGFFQDRD